MYSETDNEQLQNYIKELAVLYEIYSIPTSLISKKDLARIVLNKTVRALNINFCILFLIDFNGQEYKVWDARGLSKNIINNLPFNSPFLKLIDNTNKYIIVTDEKKINNFHLLEYNFPLKHMFCQIISSGLRTEGLFAAFRLIDMPYTKIEIALFNIIVNRIGDALENISLFEELKKQNINLQKEISERRKAEKEKKILQEKLERVKRMESIELLVGGIAHDLNNILCPLVGYPQLIRMKLKNNMPIDKEIKIIEKAALQASNEVKDLATFSRQIAYPKIIINLNTVIEEYLMSATMIEYQEKYPDVKIVINLDKELKNISGSTPHLTKVVMNLVCNAYEFLPKGGELTIETSTVNIEKKISGYEEILPGCYSLLKITDTGPGILDRDIKRIFEPYYTKKIHSTTGSGLGLWVVYGIVKEHNAFIDIHSEYGNGTSFYIYFPAHEQEAETEISNKVKSSCGTERILIIDDETEIREFLSDVL